MNLDHLVPEAQEVAALPNEDRLRRVRTDRWIGYSRAVKIVDHLSRIVEGPAKQRMPNALIIGPTNNGKSMVVEKFRRRHVARSSAAPTGEAEIIPIVCMQMPSEPSISRFYALLLAAVGSPPMPRLRVSELENLALRIMRRIGARILVIDELHNLLVGKKPTQQEFLNLVRFIGNELRISIVGVGTRDAYLAIRSDDQLENRFEPMLLPIWEEGEELSSLLASFAASLPLRNPSSLGSPDVARYILARTGGTIGEIARLLTASAAVAIETGREAIDDKTFSLVDYESPIERKRSFERALR